jgi:hypothetical protein
LLLASALLALLAAPALAEVNSSGVDLDRAAGDFGSVVTFTECSVLYFAGTYNDSQRLVDLGYNVTVTSNPGDLTLANLQNYDVLIIYTTGAGIIGAYQGDIETFVSGGGGLMIRQTDYVGTIDYAPTGFEVTDYSILWPCGYENCLVDDTHPITTGLTSADLSGVFDGVESIGAGYDTILAEQCSCHYPTLATGIFGGGVVVFDAGNFSPNALDPASDAYVMQVMDYLCYNGPVSTTPATWSSVKELFR